MWGHHCVSQFWSRDSYPLDDRPLWSWQKHIMVHSSEGWEPMLPFNCPHAVAHASIIERYVLWKNQQTKKWNWTDTAWHWHICVQYTQIDAASLHTYTSSLHTTYSTIPLTLYLHPPSLFLLSLFLHNDSYLSYYIHTICMYLMRSSCACARCAGPVLVPCQFFSKTKNKAQIPAGIMIDEEEEVISDEMIQ